MSCIPGGPFIRGTNDGPENARPQETVWVHTFYMDQYEVTYAEYKACQKRKECPRAGPRYTDFNHPNMPIQGINWYDAVAYCKAHGKQLPTEAQWEKAARGPDGNLYPWGNEPVTCERAIYKNEKGRSCGLKKAISKPDTGRPWDVGSRPAGVYGLYDMVGNSWEWVADWYARSYEECGEACQGIDPKGPCDGAEECPHHNWKIVRGGSWYWDATRQTGVFRRHHVPSNDPFHHFGFRCAATVEQAAALVEQAAAAPETTEAASD
jgi:formylglycine-generating enzyme required for sulfatase activity